MPRKPAKPCVIDGYLSHARECYHQIGATNAAVVAFPPPLPAGRRVCGTRLSRYLPSHPPLPPPWRADKMPGANGRGFAYVYSHDHGGEAMQVRVLPRKNDARRIAISAHRGAGTGEAGY
jgi:hypothetical protein